MNAWRPLSGAATATRRQGLLARARHYLEGHEVLAVDTPALSPFAGSDPNLACIAAQVGGDRYYLQTSPEFAMKRLLAAGYPDIYSICRVFRDGECGPKHLPEFTMLEWYRRGFGLAEIVTDTIRLIAACLDAPALADSAAVLDYADAFRSSAGVDALTAGCDELAACVAADDRLRDSIGSDRDAWLDLALTTIVAPSFDRDRLTVLRHYPASQAALARLCPADSRVADRFEVFCGAMELANGYVELTDAGEQRARFENDLDRRRRLGLPASAWDTRLVAALESGLPACAGVALGIERVQMLLERTDDIRNVVTFGFEARDD